jgi:hypothetical protein
MANFIRNARSEMLVRRRVRWQTLLQIDTIWSDPGGRFRIVAVVEYQRAQRHMDV